MKETVTSRKSCVAGGPGGISCTNRLDTHPNITIHLFPSEKDLARRRQWISFVRRHMPDFVPGKCPYLCSAHFTEDCFDLNRAIARQLGKIIRLKKDAVPTIHVGGAEASEPQMEPPLTPRERRMVCTLGFSSLLQSKSKNLFYL